MTVSRGRRIGRSIGSILASVTNIMAGYIWAKYGLIWGFVFWLIPVIVALALYGALQFPWKEKRLT